MTGVPNNIVEPIFAIDFDSSKAGAADSDFPVQLLCIGQKLSTGEEDSEVKLVYRNADEVGAAFGYGSQIHGMAVAIFNNLISVPVTFIALDDSVSTPTASNHSLTFTGPATANGELVIYIKGIRYAVSVESGDTATEVCTALKAVLDAYASILPVTVTDNLDGTMDLDARNKGVAAGDIDVRFNYNDGEKFPAGISVADIFTAGTVDPTVQDALDVIGDEWFPVIVSAYDDATNMGLVETYLTNRSSILIRKEGLCYYAKRDTVANLVTFATNANRNSKYSVLFSCENRCESTFDLAAGIAALVAQSVIDDPAKPLKSMKLNGFLTVSKNDKMEFLDRNTLASNGVSTLTDDNGVQTSSMITMYLKNDAGAPDNAWKQQNIMYTLLASRYLFEMQIQTKYSRAKLAVSAKGVDPDQQIMTPTIGVSEAAVWYHDCVRRGLFEGGDELFETFLTLLNVERDESNENRMNWTLPPNLMNQFLVGSGTIQFRQ